MVVFAASAVPMLRLVFVPILLDAAILILMLGFQVLAKRFNQFIIGSLFTPSFGMLSL